MAQTHVFQVRTGRERRIQEELLRVRETDEKVGQVLEDVLVPTFRVRDMKKNKAVERQRLHFPGYVFIRLNPSAAGPDVVRYVMWRLKHTPGVVRYLGSATDEEASRVEEMATAPPEAMLRSAVSFEREDAVRIVDGPFANFAGTVEEVLEDKRRLKVRVTIFGRSTPVELSFDQVEKL